LWKPINAESAVFNRVSVSIMIEAIWIKGTISGLLKIVFPIRPEKKKLEIGKEKRNKQL